MADVQKGWRGHGQGHSLWAPQRTRMAFFRRREKYCNNGGIAFAHHHGGLAAGVPARGVRERDHGPPSWFPRSCPFAGEKLWGP
jgi:hypothetical protein